MLGVLVLQSGLLLLAFLFYRLVYEQMERLAVNIRTDHSQQERTEATLARMEAAARVVAKELAESVERADAADETIPGSSADAALRKGEQ